MIEHTSKLSDVAYKSLKKRVLSTDSGSYISARQFAEEIGLSYTPVREAFLRLQKEGSLRLVPNVGFFVAKMDIAELVQIFQVRECIEAFVLDKVFDRITPDHIEQMKSLSAQQTDALTRGNISDYQQLDIKFHEILFNLYGNRHLLNFYRDIREQYMICSKEIANSYSHGAVTEHSQYFACLESGDKEQAISCLKKHIANAKERMTEGYITVIT